MMRSLAALRLPSDTGHDQVAAEGEPGAPDRFGRHDHRCYAALHVLDAMAVEPPTLHAGRPRIARATEHQGIDVEVAVEHEAPAAPRSAERGDGLKPPRFHLLKLHVVATSLEVSGQEAGDRRLVGTKARDPDEFPGELDDLTLVQFRQHALLDGCVHSMGSFRALDADRGLPAPTGDRPTVRSDTGHVERGTQCSGIMERHAGVDKHRGPAYGAA